MSYIRARSTCIDTESHCNPILQSLRFYTPSLDLGHLNFHLTTSMSSSDNADVAGLMGPEMAANVSFFGQFVHVSQIVMITEMAVYGALQ